MRARHERLRSESLAGRLRILFEDSALFGGAAAVTRALSLITFPILTRALSREDFGAVDAIAIFTAAVGPLLALGMDTAIARYFYEWDDRATRRRVVSEGLAVVAIVTTVGTTILLGFSRPLITWLVGADDYLFVFRIAVATVFFSVFVAFSQNLLKWTFDRWRYLVVSLGWASTSVTLVALFVAGFGWGVEGVFGAYAVSSTIFAVVGMAMIRPYLVRLDSLPFIRRLLAFGWPAMVVAVACGVMPTVDRWMVQRLLGLSTLAGFAVGVKVASLLQLPSQGFLTMWGPFAFATFRDPEATRSYNAVLRWYAAILSGAGLSIVLVAEPLVRVFATARYLDSVSLVAPLVAALVVEALAGVASIGLELSKRMDVKAGGYLVGVVTGLVALPLGIAAGGVVGAAWAVLAARSVLAVTTVALALRVYPLRFEWGRVAFTMIVCAAAAMLLGVGGDVGSVRRWLLDLSIVAVAAAAVWTVGLQRDDRRVFAAFRERPAANEGPGPR